MVVKYCEKRDKKFPSSLVEKKNHFLIISWDAGEVWIKHLHGFEKGISFATERWA